MDPLTVVDNPVSSFKDDGLVISVVSISFKIIFMMIRKSFSRNESVGLASSVVIGFGDSPTLVSWFWGRMTVYFFKIKSLCLSKPNLYSSSSKVRFLYGRKICLGSLFLMNGLSFDHFETFSKSTKSKRSSEFLIRFL